MTETQQDLEDTTGLTPEEIESYWKSASLRCTDSSTASGLKYSSASIAAVWIKHVDQIDESDSKNSSYELIRGITKLICSTNDEFRQPFGDQSFVERWSKIASWSSTTTPAILTKRITWMSHCLWNASHVCKHPKTNAYTGYSIIRRNQWSCADVRNGLISMMSMCKDELSADAVIILSKCISSLISPIPESLHSERFQVFRSLDFLVNCVDPLIQHATGEECVRSVLHVLIGFTLFDPDEWISEFCRLRCSQIFEMLLQRVSTVSVELCATLNIFLNQVIQGVSWASRDFRGRQYRQLFVLECIVKFSGECENSDFTPFLSQVMGSPSSLEAARYLTNSENFLRIFRKSEKMLQLLHCFVKFREVIEDINLEKATILIDHFLEVDPKNQFVYMIIGNLIAVPGEGLAKRIETFCTGDRLEHLFEKMKQSIQMDLSSSALSLLFQILQIEDSYTKTRCNRVFHDTSILNVVFRELKSCYHLPLLKIAEHYVSPEQMLQFLNKLSTDSCNSFEFGGYVDLLQQVWVKIQQQSFQTQLEAVSIIQRVCSQLLHSASTHKNATAILNLLTNISCRRNIEFRIREQFFTTATALGLSRVCTMVNDEAFTFETIRIVGEMGCGASHSPQWSVFSSCFWDTVVEAFKQGMDLKFSICMIETIYNMSSYGANDVSRKPHFVPLLEQLKGEVLGHSDFHVHLCEGMKANVLERKRKKKVLKHC
eukprot:PhF_6_TR30413/c0_g1_i1/m.44607